VIDDRWHSRVAAAVGAPAHDEVPALQWSSDSYWRDLPVDGFETYIRDRRGRAAMATNDGVTMLVGWPTAEAAGLPDRSRAQLPGGASAGRPALRASPARRCPTSSAGRTAPAGSSSVTPEHPRLDHRPGISDALGAEQVTPALDAVFTAGAGVTATDERR
jgi:hypothetical protein